MLSQSIRVKTLIDQLFRFKYLIVTTRPNALNFVTEEKFDRRIESAGFNGKGAIEYINRFFTNRQQLLDKAIQNYFQGGKDQSLLSYFADKKDETNHQIHLQLEKVNLYKNIDSLQNEENIRAIIKEYCYLTRDELIQLIRDNIHIRELTNSPLDLTILCLVTSEYSDLGRFKANFNIITLYQEFILWIGKRYIIKNQKLSIDSEDISLARILNLKEFNILQQIAFEGLKDEKLGITGEFIDKYTHPTQSITIREIYNFGLLKAEAYTKGHALLKQTYLFIHPNFQQFLAAKLLMEQLASDDDATSRSTAEFIAHHRNKPKYLMTLKFMVGLIQAQDSLVAIKFWEAIVCNIDGFLELGTEYKATLLMHLLKQAGLDRKTSYFITHRETMVNFIDDSIMKDTESFLRWGDKIKATGYLSDSMLEYILTVISNNSPQHSQVLVEWEETEKSELDNSPPLGNSPCFIFNPPLLTIKKAFIDILYSLISKFSHYKLYNNKIIFYTLKPYLSDERANWQTIELVIKIFTDLIKFNRENYLEPDETKELLTEVLTLIPNTNLKNSAIILIKTIIQTTNNQEIIHFSILLIRNQLSDDIAIDIISRLADGYNNLASLTFELLTYNIKTSNYIDCCLAIQTISTLPSVVCDPDHFIRFMAKELFLLLNSDESVNFRLMQTIQQIVLNNILESSTSTFIKELISPILSNPRKPLEFYVATVIFSELIQESKATLTDKPDYTPYHRIKFNPLDSISSSSYDSQQDSQINFIDLSLNSLSNFLRHDNSNIRFRAANKLENILSSSTTELKIIILNNLNTLLLMTPEAENSGIIYTIGRISSNNADVLNAGLEILIPLLTLDNARTSYSTVFAITTISQKVKITREISTSILTKLFLLLKLDHPTIIYNAIEAIGNIAISAISHDHHSIDIIFDTLVNFLNPTQDTQGLCMIKLVRHQTYSNPKAFVTPSIERLLHQSPETTPGIPHNSQPIIGIISDSIDQTPDIEDILPSIGYQNSLCNVAMNSLLKVARERNYQANKIILIKLISLTRSAEISLESSYVIVEIISALPLNKAAAYLRVSSQQIRQITIKSITIKLKEELEVNEWNEQHIKILLNIIGTKIFECEELEKNLHESAKKYLKKIIHNIDSQKLEWINNNFEQLVKSSSHTVYMMKDIYHFVLKDGIITQEISTFILNCITILSFTITISKSPSKPKFTISCTESYTFYGEENLQYLEIITKIAVTQSDDLLAQQYTKNIPLFRNTGSAVRIAACDIPDIQSIVTHRKLTVDAWEVNILHSSTDKILLLEKRNYFGEHEVYKVNLQDTDLTSIKFTYHPGNIKDLIQEIYAGIKYTKSEIAINRLEIESGYRILSLVDTAPQTIISFIENNDFSPITDSESPLDPSPTKHKRTTYLEESSTYSPGKKPKVELNNQSMEAPKKRQNSPSEEDDIETLYSPKKRQNPPKDYKKNPDTDPNIFMLHQIIYDNPPPIHPQINEKLSQSTTAKEIPEAKHEHYQSTPIHNDNLFLLSFMSKEYIESASIIKYFWKNMLHLPLADFPNFMYSNYLWIAAHYITCQIGIFSITGQMEWKVSLLKTAPYAVRILTYTFLEEQQQIALLNSEDKTINNPQDFIEKCGLDISIQAALGLFHTTAFLTASTGGLYCYYSHNQESINELSNQEMIIPYMTSISAGYLTMSNMHFNFYSEVGVILAIDQTLSIIQSMVIIHDTTTLLLLTTQELRQPAHDYLETVIGDLYDYCFKSGGDYE